jgi:hypothetical protein
MSMSDEGVGHTTSSALTNRLVTADLIIPERQQGRVDCDSRYWKPHCSHEDDGNPKNHWYYALLPGMREHSGPGQSTWADERSANHYGFSIGFERDFDQRPLAFDLVYD